MILVPGIVYESPTRPTGAIVRELAEVGLVKHEAASTIAEEPLIVRFTGVSPEAARSAIAFATSGTWTRKEDRWILVPDPAERARQLAKCRATQLASIKQQWTRPLPQIDFSLAATIERAKPPQVKSDGTSIVFGLNGDNPSDRAALELLRLFPAERLSQFTERGTTILAPSQLPPGAQAVFDRWRVRQSVLVDVEGTTGVRMSHEKAQRLPDPPQPRVTIVHSIEYVTLVLQSGLTQGTGAVYIGPPRDTSRDVRFPGDRPARLRPVSTMLRQLRETPGPVPPPLRTAMLGDEDPLGYDRADTWTQGAALANESFAASVGDDIAWYRQRPEKGELVRASYDRLVRSGQAETVGTVRAIRPGDPARARALRSDRAKLRAHLARIADGETLEEQAGYALETEYPRLSDVDFDWIKLFLDDPERPFFQRGMRVWAALGCPAGIQGIPEKKWSPRARQLIREWEADPYGTTSWSRLNFKSPLVVIDHKWKAARFATILPSDDPSEIAYAILSREREGKPIPANYQVGQRRVVSLELLLPNGRAAAERLTGPFEPVGPSVKWRDDATLVKRVERVLTRARARPAPPVRTIPPGP